MATAMLVDLRDFIIVEHVGYADASPDVEVRPPVTPTASDSRRSSLPSSASAGHEARRWRTSEIP